MTRKEKEAHKKKQKELLEARIEKLYDLYLNTKCIKEREKLISAVHNLEVKLLSVEQDVIESRYFGIKEVSSFNISKS